MITVALLALLSALAVMMGTRKTEKKAAFWYCFVAFLVAAWSVVTAWLYLGGNGNGWLLVGPIVAGIGMIGFYCLVLRKRIIVLEARWLKFLSYVVIMSVVAMIYMFIFYFVLTYIFKMQGVSSSIFVLNYVMITIVLVILPIVNEVTNFVNSLIRKGQVDLNFIVRRLNRMATEDVDLDELSKFLARNLHFSYIGMIVGEKLYGSKSLTVKRLELKPLTELGEPEYGIWQDLDGEARQLCDELGVKAVAELRNAKGESFGQILVGRPLGKMGFERRDLIQLEAIVNLVAAIIDTRARGLRR